MGATIEQVLAHATTLIAAKKAFDDSIIDYGDDLIAQKEAEKEATESAPVLPAPRREAPKRKAPVARKVAVATRRKAPLALPSPGPERTPKQRAAGGEGGGGEREGGQRRAPGDAAARDPKEVRLRRRGDFRRSRAGARRERRRVALLLRQRLRAPRPLRAAAW